MGTTTLSWPLTVMVSGHPPGANQRLHWQARRRLCRPFVDAIGWQARAFELQQPLERARVVVTFIHRSRRYLGDVDNLYSRAKPLVDALKGILIVDDSPAHLELDVRQELGGERSVRLEVWPAEHADDNREDVTLVQNAHHLCDVAGDGDVTDKAQRRIVYRQAPLAEHERTARIVAAIEALLELPPLNACEDQSEG